MARIALAAHLDNAKLYCPSPNRICSARSARLSPIRDARITLDAPSPADILCTVSTLTLTDLAASKLLANADRHADDGIFSRDLIDLAMLNLDLAQLRQALIKAESAYGHSIRRDLNTAIERMHQRPGWNAACRPWPSIFRKPGYGRGFAP